MASQSVVLKSSVKLSQGCQIDWRFKNH